MRKYIKYTIESIKIGGFKLFLISLKYFLLKKAPKNNIRINNSIMGIYSCRENTTDFMYAFFSYENKIKSKIISTIDDFDTFIDIGACIGDYSIWLAKNNLKCFAFEPNNDNYNSLINNIELNNLTESIETYNYGLGKKTEKVFFETNITNRGYSGKYANFKEGFKEEVEIKTFDEIFESMGISYNQSIIIKIDAEGMEAEIIEGAMKSFSKIRKIFLIFESHTGADIILKKLMEIASYQIIELDALNMGVLINNTTKELS
jgi:FkbM family methyltransferase